MSNSTPGPWESSKSGMSVMGSEDGNCFSICNVVEHWRDGRQGNARLIAAAPDLLAAYMSAFNYLEFIESPNALLKLQLQTAIIKALGNQ